MSCARVLRRPRDRNSGRSACPCSAGQTYPANVRAAYHEELTALTEQLGQMCGWPASRWNAPPKRCCRPTYCWPNQVIAEHDQITAMSAQAAERAFVLLALQAPVAGDLPGHHRRHPDCCEHRPDGRALALHVAKIARRRHPQHALPEQVNGYFAEMGRVASRTG